MEQLLINKLTKEIVYAFVSCFPLTFTILNLKERLPAAGLLYPQGGRAR